MRVSGSGIYASEVDQTLRLGRRLPKHEEYVLLCQTQILTEVSSERQLSRLRLIFVRSD